MKAVRVNEKFDMEIVDICEPVIENDDEVKIKVKATGICGSDIGIFNGTNPMVTYPRIIGHEMSGEVVDVGESISHVKKGDRVVVDPVTESGMSPEAIIGRSNVSNDLKVRGVHLDGFMQEYIISKKDRVYKLEGLDYNTMALIEPFTIGANANWRAETSPRDNVFVNGAGTIGQTVLRTAILRGARVYVSDIDQEKLEIASDMGAYETIDMSGKDTVKEALKANPYGYDVVIDCVCSTDSFSDCIQITAPAARVISLGFSNDFSKIKQKWITSKELDIRGSRLSNKKFSEVIRAIEDKRINTEKIITHTYPIEKVKDAFELSLDGSRKSGKILITF
ncbi:MAG: alcohol dehydrogenase catalytic domain-containing protein [Tissierellia bacterium]|nr:alcohol dehydrogenase catalytic domain-containing protein [Tissierellia bacterium]